MRRIFWRHQAGFWLTVLLTALFGWLILGAPSCERSQQAILGLTGVVVLWYTFFTYALVNNPPPPLLKLRVVEAHRGTVNEGAGIFIDCENLTASGSVAMSWDVSGGRNGEAMVFPEGLRAFAREVVLYPGEMDRSAVTLAPVKPSNPLFGIDIAIGEPEEAIVRLRLRWKDETGDRAVIEEYWSVDVRRGYGKRMTDLTMATVWYSRLGAPETSSAKRS